MHRSSKMAALLAAGLVSPWSAVAEESEAILSGMVVSAAKIQQTTAEAPSSVTVVTSRDIENSNAIRLGDVMTSQVPSLYLRGGAVGNTTRDAGSSIISLRGAYGARTKVVLDGVASLADANSGNLNLSTLSLGDVDRIEVVPGVSSSLYGSDAIGGVINIVTKAPAQREVSGRIAKGFDDGARTLYEAGYRDKWANGLGMSLSYYRQEMDGYARNDLITATPTACGTCTTPVTGWEKTTGNTGTTTYVIGDKGKVPSLSENFNGTLYFDISPTAKVKAGMTRYESRMGYEHYNLYLASAAGPVTLPATNLVIDGQRVASLTERSTWMANVSERKETRYFAGYEGKLNGDYLLKVDLSHFDRDYYYLSPATAGITYAGGPGTSTHTPNTTRDLLAQLSFPVGARHFIVSGIGVNRQSLNRKVYAVTDYRDDNSKTVVNDQGDGYSQTRSLFVQDQFSATEDLTLYAGARYDNWSTRGFIAKWVGGVTPPRDVPERSEAAVSPRLAAVYRLTNAMSLKASVGEAFRSPTLYDMYAADTVSGAKLITSDANLKPERAWAWDLGTEINWTNGASFKAAYFLTRIRDMIYSKESPYTGPYTASIPATVTILSQKTNAAEGETEGIELSGSLPLAGWLSASGSYTFTDAKVTKDNTGIIDPATGQPALLGKHLVFVPRHMASIAFQGKYDKWSGSLSNRYTGLTFSNATNSDSTKDVFTGVSKYWISDLKVSYQFDKNLKASLTVNNLLDKKYYQYYLMPGRNLGIELAAKF